MSVHGPGRAHYHSSGSGSSSDDARPHSRRSSVSVALTTASTCDSSAAPDTGAFGRLLASPVAGEPHVSFFDDGFAFDALVDVDAELAKTGPHAGFVDFSAGHDQHDPDHFDLLASNAADASAASDAPHQPAATSAV